MLTPIASKEGSASGPAALFALIQAPRRAFFPRLLARHPLIWSTVFLAGVLFLTLTLALSQLHGTLNDATVDLLPSESVVVLLIGVSVIPLRMIFLPVTGFVLVYIVGFAVKYWLENTYLPPGLDLVPAFGISLLLNGSVALAAALGGKAAFHLFARSNRWADLALSGATAVIYFLLASVVTRVMADAVYLPEWSGRDFGLVGLADIAAIKAFRIALCSGVLLLFLLDVPSWAQFRRAITVLPMFLLGGLAARFGFALHPPVDLMLLCLVATLVLPGYSAILGNIIGLISYVALTGVMLVQEPLRSADALRLEAVSLVLIVVVYLLLLFRHQAHADTEHDRATLQRLQRVHDFATIGYFVFDVNRAQVQVDAVAGAILGTGRSFDAVAFLDRVRPADKANVAKAMSERREEATLVAFSLSRGGEWSEETTEQKHVAIYSWYEQLWDGRMIAYGALLDRTDEYNRATALGKALADLSEQQNRQTQLFSIVSHEIRTPASVISMLVEEIDAGASWAQMGPRMKAVSEQLLSVLADMRQTVRPEENLPIRLEPFRPQELAETVRNTFLLMAEARGVQLVLNLPSEADEERISDRVRLNQVLSNLVKNALVHAECKRIAISYAEETADGQLFAIWRVNDDGRGIPAAERGRLFLPFSRITGTGHAHADGSGLGLYVTKTSVELLGGTVDYREGHPRGSEFVIRVPEARGATAKPVKKLDAAKVAAGFRKALIVEDSDLIGELLVARLQRLVPEVIWARSGLEGLEAQERELPDLILTDLFMPKMGGDEMTAQLRGRGVTTPVIGMTAAAIGDERTKFEHAGTDFVLTKPVSTSQLVEALARLSSGESAAD